MTSRTGLLDEHAVLWTFCEVPGIYDALDRNNRTASSRSSFEYGGVFGIDRHPL